MQCATGEQLLCILRRKRVGKLKDPTIGNNRRADRWGNQCTVRVAVATGALISGNGFGSLRRSYKSPTTDRSRARHPHLPPLKRVCWSDITMAGLAPNRPVDRYLVVLMAASVYS